MTTFPALEIYGRSKVILTLPTLNPAKRKCCREEMSVAVVTTESEVPGYSRPYQSLYHRSVLGTGGILAEL